MDGGRRSWPGWKAAFRDYRSGDHHTGRHLAQFHILRDLARIGSAPRYLNKGWRGASLSGEREAAREPFLNGRETDGDCVNSSVL